MKKVFWLLIVPFILFSGFTIKGNHSGGDQDKAEKAPDFTLTDINGKKVSLSDFKGKVVVMDIWATWCGPCMYALKHSHKPKKEFHGNPDIVFLYISIDKEDAKENWKKVVEQKEIEGIHVISYAGKDSNILSKYGVMSIPRFILIDKNGNIADPDAKAPYEEGWADDIRKLLDQ